MIARAARAVVVGLAARPSPPAPWGARHNLEEVAIFARFRSARIEFQRPVRLVVKREPKRPPQPPPAAPPEPEAPTWHLRKDGSGWIIEREGEAEPVAVLRTRRQALKEADALARGARGLLVIHQANGTVERDHRLD